MLEDEGVYGTIHFGIGDNHTMGGCVEASMHTDVVVKNPTVFIDKKMVIKSGKHIY
jgi:leucyl aminopeptidase (aminopeptidase T)